MLTESPNMLCSRHGGPRVKLSLWPFCGWILRLTKAIWARVVKCSMDSKFCWQYWVARHILKKPMKWKAQEFYARAMAELAITLFGRERGNARLVMIKWLKYSPRKALRGKLPVRYQGLTLRFAVNVDFKLLNKLFGLKFDDK